MSFKEKVIFTRKLSSPKTHSKGMTVISHYKPKGSECKQYKQSYCNWKFTNYQISV